MVQRLPAEILLIIDNKLYSNKDRLSCLKVCSKWNYLFQKSLYRSIQIKDKIKFQKFYQRCFAVGVFVKSIELSQFIPSKEEMYYLPRICPNIESLHFNQNLWEKGDEKALIELVTKLTLYSLSTISLQSTISNQIIKSNISTLTDLTLSLYLPLQQQLLPINQLESLKINIEYGGMHCISIMDLEYIHECYPTLKSLEITGPANYNELVFDSTINKSIQPSFTLKSFKSNQRINNNSSYWIEYIKLKYPLIEILELQDTTIIHSLSANHPWHKLVLYCTRLQSLSLIGFTPDQHFFTSLLKCRNNIKALKFSTTTGNNQQQPTVIPISSILNQFKDTIEELLIWPCHIIDSTIDIIHSNLTLCYNLERLNISGIHLVSNGGLLEIPIDKLIKYGIHLRNLNLEYATLTHDDSTTTTTTTSLQHVSFNHVTLTNNVIQYTSDTCPYIKHFSLLNCQFVNCNNMIKIDMSNHEFDLFYISNCYQDNSKLLVPTKTCLKLNQSYYNYNNNEWIKKTLQWWNNNNNNNNNLIIIIQYSSMNQFYIK